MLTLRSGNFFGGALTNRGQWNGVLKPMWRLLYEPVRHQVTCKKVFVIAERDIPLKKGKPVRVLWTGE